LRVAIVDDENRPGALQNTPPRILKRRPGECANGFEA
jgi:hypothetical protein